MASADARRDRRAGRARRVRAARRLLRSVHVDGDVRQRHARHALRAARAGQRDGRVGARTAPARGAASCRTARCSPRARSSTTPAPRCAACSCATGCSARPSRRRRPPSPSTSRRPRPRSPCKVDRYAAHRSGGCASCHNQTDPIGFGLENYDRTGAYRDRRQGQPAVHDHRRRRGRRPGRRSTARPSWPTLITGSGSLESCVVTQLYRMALGRRESRRRHARRWRS